MTRRRVNTDPLRAVAEAVPHVGQGGILSPQYFAIRWWELKLECGHEEERTMRFPGSGRGFGRLHHPPSLDLAAPPPKRVRCATCALLEATTDD